MCKKLIYLISFVLMLGPVLTNAASAADPNLVGWWKLDRNADDSSGGGRNGTTYGTTPPPYIAGPTYGAGLPFYADNNAISLGGNTPQQYVDLPIGDIISGLTSSTFAIWVNFRQSGGSNKWQRFFDFGPSYSTAPTDYMFLAPRRSSSAPPHFEITTGGVTQRVSWGPYNNNGTFIPTYQWLHFAITISDVNSAGYRTYRMYVNGNQVDVNTANTLTPSSLGVTNYNWLGRSLDTDVGGLYLPGYLDDFRIYNRELSQTEIRQAMGYPIASFPAPANGIVLAPGTPVTLTWIKGAFVAGVNGHHVYFGDNLSNVQNGTGGTDKGLTSDTTYTPTGLVPGPIYYWRIDEVNGVNIWQGQIWSFRILPTIAWGSTPSDGAPLVAPKMTLRWRAGSGAVTGHNVYLSDNFDQVNNAATGSTVLPFRKFLTPTADPNWNPAKAGVALGYNTTYYWRVDEVNSVKIYKGDVWRFTTVPNAPPEPNLVGWWKLDGDVNDSGYGCNGTEIGGPTYVDGIFGRAIYINNVNNTNPDDDIYADLPIGSVISTLTNCTFAVWVDWTESFSNQRFFMFGTEPANHLHLAPHNSASAPAHFQIVSGGVANIVGYGANTFGGNPGTLMPTNEWHHLTVTISDPNAGGIRTYRLYLDGEQVGENTNVTLTPSNLGFTTQNWLGRSEDPVTQRPYRGYLDDFRIYDRALSQSEVKSLIIPPWAWNPSPADSATGVETTPTISWKPGGRAAKHDVYFSDNFDDVNSATTSSPPTIYKGRFDPNNYNITTPLEWGRTYYWRIDEVNDPNIWPGNIWSFTVRNFLVVDDFESYTNSDPNIIFKIWKDGVGYSPGNGTGSQVGYRDPNYAEVTIVNGGTQSMPVDYDNTKLPYYSEADHTFDTPQNWTAYGPYSLKSLTLWFRGYPASVGSFVENPAGTYTITASGANIGDVSPTRGGGYHDEFHFGYKEVTAADVEEGLVTIVAKVESVGNAGDTVGKAGVMIRDSLDPNSTHGIMYVSPTSGATFQRRLEAGGASSSTTTTGITAPYWVKLVLDPLFGNLRAYQSPTGNSDDWTQIGESQQIPTMTLPRTLPIYVGLAVTPQSTANIRKATFSNVTITAGAMGAWNHRDIGIKSNVAAPLYVTLQDSKTPTPGTKTVTHPDPYILLQDTWQEWDIALSDFSGVDPTKIKKITIGVGSGSAGGTGTIYVDDIRLYVPRCIPGRRAPDFTGSDCIVDYQDLQILTNNWLISDYQVTPQVGWDPNSDPNLAGYYKFDGNFNDSSGKGNNGDPCNTGVTTITDPARGKVASFDGINDYIAITRLVQDDFTLMAWIKTAIPGGAQGGTRAWQGSGLLWSDVSGAASDFILAVLGAKLSFGTGPTNQDTTSGGDVVTGQWVHVAVARTRSSGRIEFFIDGILDTTAIHSNTGSLNANPKINIGGNTVDSRYYTGLIDDVRIYSRVLSQAEVAYLAGKTTPFTQPLYLLLTQQNSAINLYNDGTIDLRDYAVLADTWLEVLLWP